MNCARSRASSHGVCETERRRSRHASIASAMVRELGDGIGGETLSLFCSEERVDNVVEIPVENILEIAGREGDAMVGQPVLRVVVGPYLLAAVTRADLGSASGCRSFFLLAEFGFIQVRA